LPKNTIFVDTSAIYALSDKGDQCHQLATQFFASLSPHIQLVISDFVLLESWMLIDRRVGRHPALTFYNDALTGVFDIIKIRRANLLAASRIMEKYADQDFSLADCTSFNLMEYLHINRVFTFDSHFKIYRKTDGTSFEILP
jgi:predicted nucleic acid-binding protein